ncbi:MAG TPA: hypothetical protein VMG12_13910 [Polyangiaceae bacterium]|nr:hypothetical protein [Polyangiaceae bacterium]
MAEAEKLRFRGIEPTGIGAVGRRHAQRHADDAAAIGADPGEPFAVERGLALGQPSS